MLEHVIPIVHECDEKKFSNEDTGFPFDDSDEFGENFTRNSNGRGSINKHLEDLASRFPEFSEQLRGWDTEGESDRFAPLRNSRFDNRWHTNDRGANRRPPSEQQQHHADTSSHASEQNGNPSASQDTKLPQYGLRNTTDLAAKTPIDETLKREQRSMSAPPDNRGSNQSQPRFVSHVNIEPKQTESPPKSHTATPHDMGNQFAKKTSNVRHIPIFVEGRDEPIVPKDVDESDSTAPNKPRDVPIHHDNGYAAAPPPPMQNPRFQRTASPFEDAFQHPFGLNRPSFYQQQQQPPHHQQPFAKQYDNFARQEPPSGFRQHPQQQQQQQRARSPQPPKQQQANSVPKASPQQPPHFNQQATQEQAPPAPKPQPPPPTDSLSKIKQIQDDVLELMKSVEAFSGTKKDKEYLYLDEMLTRNLIKLDLIETEGKENIRLARKEAIKCIQKCISILEGKASESDKQQMETDQTSVDANKEENSENQQMDVEATNEEFKAMDIDQVSGEKENASQESTNMGEHESDSEGQSTPVSMGIQRSGTLKKVCKDGLSEASKKDNDTAPKTKVMKVIKDKTEEGKSMADSKDSDSQNNNSVDNNDLNSATNQSVESTNNTAT